jgi:hypothetical protein
MGRDQIVLNGLKKRSKGAFLCVLSTKGTHAEVSEREMSVQCQAMLGGILLRHCKLASPAVAIRLL